MWKLVKSWIKGKKSQWYQKNFCFPSKATWSKKTSVTWFCAKEITPSGSHFPIWKTLRKSLPPSTGKKLTPSPGLTVLSSLVSKVQSIFILSVRNFLKSASSDVNCRSESYFQIRTFRKLVKFSPTLVWGEIWTLSIRNCRMFRESWSKTLTMSSREASFCPVCWLWWISSLWIHYTCLNKATKANCCSIKCSSVKCTPFFRTWLQSAKLVDAITEIQKRRYIPEHEIHVR